MIHHVVALDNITVRADDIDHDVLIAYGTILNDEMERKKPLFAKAYEDLVVFGRCEMVF